MSPFTALSLKLVGAILIISSLLDYIILAIPFRFQETAWQINFTEQIVDRGIIPMVGMAFLLVGYWIESASRDSSPSGFDLRLPSFILASIFGLMFLLLVPLHLNNLRMASANVMTQIQQGAGQDEVRIQGFLEQINALSQDPQRLNQEIQQRNQVIAAGEFQGRKFSPQELEVLKQQTSQLQQLQNLAKKPKELEAKLTELKGQLQTQLRERKLEREQQAKGEAFKRGLRIGLSSLMLAIGYFVIGGLGLRGMSGMGGSPSRRRTSAR